MRKKRRLMTVLAALVFITIVTPVALLARLTGKSLLKRRSGWRDSPIHGHDDPRFPF